MAAIRPGRKFVCTPSGRLPSLVPLTFLKSPPGNRANSSRLSTFTPFLSRERSAAGSFMAASFLPMAV